MNIFTSKRGGFLTVKTNGAAQVQRLGCKSGEDRIGLREQVALERLAAGDGMAIFPPGCDAAAVREAGRVFQGDPALWDTEAMFRWHRACQAGEVPEKDQYKHSTFGRGHNGFAYLARVLQVGYLATGLTIHSNVWRTWDAAALLGYAQRIQEELRRYAGRPARRSLGAEQMRDILNDLGLDWDS